jgi:hypothetical protein
MKQVGEQWRLLSKEQRASWCFDPPAKKGDKSKRSGGAADKDAASSVSMSPAPSCSTSTDGGTSHAHASACASLAHAGAMYEAAAGGAHGRKASHGPHDQSLDGPQDRAFFGGECVGAGGRVANMGAAGGSTSDLMGLGAQFMGGQGGPWRGGFGPPWMHHQVRV